MGAEPPNRQGALREGVQPIPNLIQRVTIRAVRRLHRSHHEIGSLGVLERHVPALDLTVETDREFHRCTLFGSAVRQFHSNRRQVRPTGLPISPPVSLQHAAIGWRGPLLALPSVALTAECLPELVQRSMTESLGPKQFTRLRAWVIPVDRRAAATIRFKLRRQAPELVLSAQRQIAGEVGLVQALLDNRFVAFRRFVEPRILLPQFAPHPKPPGRHCVGHRLPHSHRAPLFRLTPAQPPDSRCGRFQTVASGFDLSGLEPVTPALLIPIRLDQTAALHAVPDRQWLAISGEQPSGFRVLDPYPGGPEHAHQQRFGIPGGTLMMRCAIRPSATACRWAQIASMGMPSTNSLVGSSTCHACITNSLN